MSAEHEPPPPPELTALLRGMRADTLTSDEVARLAQRLGPMLAEGGGGGAAPPRAVSSTGLAAIGGGIVVGAIALAIAIHFASATPIQESAPRAPDVPLADLDREASSDERVVEPASEIGHDIETGDPPASDVRATAQVPPQRIDRARVAEPRASEHTLLVDARRALDSDPARALALADRHRREFPDGALAPEREMIAIDALAALGRAPAASRRAERLAARWPESAYAARVRARGLLP